MAKVAVPPSKPPLDKGQHFLLSFPLANIKEPVKVDLLDEDDIGSCTVRVSFETFSPHKRYEKVCTLSEPVCLRQMSKNVNQKNLSIILMKAASVPPSPKSTPSQPPEAPPITLESANAIATVSVESDAHRHPSCDSGVLTEDLNVEDEVLDAEESSEKKKKKKPKKKARSNNSKSQGEENEEEEVDKEVQLAKEEIERLQSEMQSARSKIQTNRKELEVAETRESSALKKIQHFESELKRWQSEREAAQAHLGECKGRLSETQQAVKDLESQIEKQRIVVKESEARAADRQRQAAEEERKRLEELEILAQEEKRKEQEERRKRKEEDNQRAAEEKRKKEADRKENARKREEERKLKEAEEERLKAERKKKMGGSNTPLKDFTNGGYNVVVSESDNALIKRLTAMFPKDPATASKLLEQAGDAGGIAFYLCLSQLHEDSGNDPECGAVLLKILAHPKVKETIGEKERGMLATRAMAKLKDHPAKIRECKSLLDKLRPEYGILGMSQFLSEDVSRTSRSKATEASEKPWTGPLIEELPVEPNVPSNGKSGNMRAPAASNVTTAEKNAGWVLGTNTEDMVACWTLELAVPSIESLAEVNLDISQEAVRLTPVQGGLPVAESMVPDDADADSATAKWSKKKRVLTIRMPQVSI